MLPVKRRLRKMCDILKPFLESQLFGIILGAVLTGGFTWFIEISKSSKDEKLYLKRKREALYQKMYDFSMRYEKDIRTKKNIWMSKDTKDLWNTIQVDSIFGSQKTMDWFYDLYAEFQENLMKSPNNIKRVHNKNHKKILEFYVHIKKELGIED